ncbi:MAG: hypothetical protein OEV73_01035 [Desulfobulbaceae bacterium]|nr:hypothetical protein [Desulfobulbaceae bacterium]
MTTPSAPTRLAFPLLVLACILAACAVPASRYLSAGPTALAEGGDPRQAAVLLHPFTEAFAADARIGRHLFTNNRQTELLVKPGSVGRALDAILQRKLLDGNIAVAQDGSRWDQTPAGLAAFADPNRLLLSGRITRLTLEVEEKPLSGKARAEMEVECILGVVKDKKVIRRNVHVAQEMITLSFGPQELEKLLADCLSAASAEILVQCGDLVAAVPAGTRRQPQPTQANENKLSPNHERTSQTDRGGDSHRTPAATARAVAVQSPPA